LHARAQPLVFVVDGCVDAVAQKSRRAQLARGSRQAEHPAAHDALSGTRRQDLEEVHLIGKHIDAEIRQRAVEPPATSQVLGQMAGRLPDQRLIQAFGPA